MKRMSLGRRKKLLTLGPVLVLITLGEDGCLLVTEKKEVRVPIYRVENVVDTTGAGDPFNSAFVSPIHKGMLTQRGGRLCLSRSSSFGDQNRSLMLFWEKAEEFIASKPPRGK